MIEEDAYTCSVAGVSRVRLGSSRHMLFFTTAHPLSCQSAQLVKCDSRCPIGSVSNSSFCVRRLVREGLICVCFVRHGWEEVAFVFLGHLGG